MGKSNKCAICAKRGTKGWFQVPKESPSDNTPKRQWLSVINPEEEVTESTRVCFRHFSRDDITITLKGFAKLNSG